MTDEESIDLIASKIHLLQRSQFINLPLLPLLLLSDFNSSSIQNNLSTSKNYANPPPTPPPPTSFTMNSNKDVEKNKSSLRNSNDTNDWSRLNNISDTKERSFFRRLLMSYWCPRPINGAQMLLEELKYSYCFSTGIDKNLLHHKKDIEGCSSMKSLHLDNLLNGGLRTSEITEIIGKSSCGKTQDIKQYLTRIRCCLVPTFGHLIDSLITIRMHIDKAQRHLHSLSTPTEEFFSNCKLIIIDSLTMPFLSCMSTLPQLDKAQRHLHSLSTPTEEFFSNCKLIIIDSLTMPFLSCMSTLPQLGISQLALIISELQRLSTLYHCTILVTNHARSQFINFLNKQQFNRNSCSLPPTSIGCLGINWSLIPNHRVLFECLTPWTNSLSCKIKVQLVNNNLHKINKQTNHCNKHQCNSETVWEFTV
ncbi:RAD51-like protein 3 [Schistosoma bovis]|uniref:RAD51-like protein 3 n=1 Tax=Schistosoma bovis TaxID=6184 RepID=A0A430QFB3_SCHBO|nr:RAD51-like protein 3 [Schistosoma bovis]